MPHLARHVRCTCKKTNERGKAVECHALATLVQGYDSDLHARYRCTDDACKGLTIVCANAEHRNG